MNGNDGRARWKQAVADAVATGVPGAASLARKEAARRLREAEQACQDIPRWLPPWLYRRRMDAAMHEWRQANVALFDAEVAGLRPPAGLA